MKKLNLRRCYLFSLLSAPFFLGANELNQTNSMRLYEQFNQNQGVLTVGLMQGHVGQKNGRCQKSSFALYERQAKGFDRIALGHEWRSVWLRASVEGQLSGLSQQAVKEGLGTQKGEASIKSAAGVVMQGSCRLPIKGLQLRGDFAWHRGNVLLEAGGMKRNPVNCNIGVYYQLNPNWQVKAAYKRTLKANQTGKFELTCQWNLNKSKDAYRGFFELQRSPIHLMIGQQNQNNDEPLDPELGESAKTKAKNYIFHSKLFNEISLGDLYLSEGSLGSTEGDAVTKFLTFLRTKILGSDLVDQKEITGELNLQIALLEGMNKNIQILKYIPLESVPDIVKHLKDNSSQFLGSQGRAQVFKESILLKNSLQIKSSFNSLKMAYKDLKDFESEILKNRVLENKKLEIETLQKKACLVLNLFNSIKEINKNYEQSKKERNRKSISFKQERDIIAEKYKNDLKNNFSKIQTLQKIRSKINVLTNKERNILNNFFHQINYVENEIFKFKEEISINERISERLEKEIRKMNLNLSNLVNF